MLRYILPRKISVGRTPAESAVVEAVEDASIVLGLKRIPDIFLFEAMPFVFLSGLQKNNREAIYLSIPFLLLHPEKIRSNIFLQIFSMTKYDTAHSKLSKIFMPDSEAYTRAFMAETEYSVACSNHVDVFRDTPFVFRIMTPYFDKSRIDVGSDCNSSSWGSPLQDAFKHLNEEERLAMRHKKDAINISLSAILGTNNIPSSVPTLKKKRYSVPRDRMEIVLDAAFLSIRHSGKDTLLRVCSDVYAIMKSIELSPLEKTICKKFYQRLFILSFEDYL